MAPGVALPASTDLLIAYIVGMILRWLLLVLYPLIRTLMASVAFAMNRRGASKSLERWIRFWIFALAVKIVEVIIPMQLVYWVVKYFIIVSLVTTWSTVRLDLNLIER